MKVVVLDDEEKVCNLILQLVDWDSLGMKVVGTAYNGIDGLALVEREQPDLVITDIRMPGLDGLELIGRVKNGMTGTEFIIISGYHHFEYAHNAIRFGVEDYLLKPIKQSELNATLRKISERHRHRLDAEKNTLELEYRLKSTLGKLRQDFFNDMILGFEKNLPMTIPEVNATYGYHFCDGIFQFILIKIDCPPAEFSDGMVRMLLDSTREVSYALLTSICTELELYQIGPRIHVLLNYPTTEAQRIRRQVKAMSDELQVRKSIFEVVDLNIALGIPVGDIKQSKESHVSSEMAIGQRLVSPKGHLYEDHPAVQPGLHEDSLAVWNRQMERACEAMDQELALEATEALTTAVRSHSHCTGTQVLETLKEAGSRLFTLVKNRCDGIGDLAEMESGFLHAMDLAGTSDELGDRLRTLVQTTIERISIQRHLCETRPIRDAKKFIAEHYRDSGISLEQVAQAIKLNTSYFSLLFKKETNTGFLEYLTNVRITQAKELLRSTNITIAQVAYEVGYSDTKHFTRLFIRLAGIKPSAYRKLYG